MATKKLINNRYLRARPPAPSGQRVEVFDTRIPGFGVRISDTEDDDPARRGEAGKITFLLYARFSPGAAPTRRTIGVFGAVTLEKARFIAGEWRSQIEKASTPPSSRPRPVIRKPTSGLCASSIRLPTSRKPSLLTNCRRSDAVRGQSMNCAPSSSRHGRIGRSARSPRSTCWRSSTPKSASRRTGPPRCWPSLRGSSTGLLMHLLEANWTSKASGSSTV